MKVLWLCNTLIPEIAEKYGISYLKPESWISGMYHLMRNYDDVSLLYVYPTDKTEQVCCDESNLFIPYKREGNVEECFNKIILLYKPDVIQLFGTENSDTKSMIVCAQKNGLIDKVIVNIQGILHSIAEHYTVGLPTSVIYRYSLRDMVKNDNIYRAQLKFKKRAEKEADVLKAVHHVTGRTDMDYAISKQINPMINYYFCNEILRDSFYFDRWSLGECEKHSVFVSQSNYPIKGFHIFLRAFSEIVKHYPDAKLYTTGKNPFPQTLKGKLLQTSYSKYIAKLIKEYGLQDSVFFLGTLSEEKMKERFLKSHVFVCCSTIENSPNSLGEAMMLGVPSVSSDVGGVKNLFTHEVDGFIYQADAYYMAASYIMKLFDNDSLAISFSNNEREHAINIYNKKKNLEDTIKIYKRVCDN